ncbi:MAG: hypothetical protein ACYTF1_15285 [Planctomycetota bacterium]
MKNINYLFITVLLLAASTTFAQEKKKDNTGTNPVNFTYDYRLYTEMRQFKNDGGSLIKHTMEFRAPLGSNIANLKGQEEGFYRELGSRFALRFRAYYNSMSVGNQEGDPFASNNVSGIGDYDARILAIAYSSGSFVLAPGLEAFFNTASNSALGSGSTTLAPVLFGVFVGALGKGSLFAPGYQYVFDVDGNPVSRSQIDLYFVWILAAGKNWLTLDPQIILDHNNDVEFMTIDAEWGFMIAPKVGLSGYLRPGIGIGADRPFAYNLEVAVKYVWR